MIPDSTFSTPGHPPSTETIVTSFLPAGGLQRLVGARGRGSLIVYTRLMSGSRCSRFSIAVRPPFGAALGHVVADDAQVVLVADHPLVADVDAEALEEPLVPGDVDGDLVRVEIEHGDPRLGARRLERRLRPLADQLAGPEVVGGERGVGASAGSSWGVEGDHEQTGLAGPVERRHDRFESFGVIRMPAAPAAMRLSTRRPATGCRRPPRRRRTGARCPAPRPWPRPPRAS